MANAVRESNLPTIIRAHVQSRLGESVEGLVEFQFDVLGSRSRPKLHYRRWLMPPGLWAAEPTEQRKFFAELLPIAMDQASGLLTAALGR